MNERVTFCARCNLVIPWGRTLCHSCLRAEVAMEREERARAGARRSPLPERECRSCYTPVDRRAPICPHCGQDPGVEFWETRRAPEPSRAGPWVAAACLLVVLPLVCFLMFTLFLPG